MDRSRNETSLNRLVSSRDVFHVYSTGSIGMVHLLGIIGCLQDSPSGLLGIVGAPWPEKTPGDSQERQQLLDRFITGASHGFLLGCGAVDRRLQYGQPGSVVEHDFVPLRKTRNPSMNLVIGFEIGRMTRFIDGFRVFLNDCPHEMFFIDCTSVAFDQPPREITMCEASKKPPLKFKVRIDDMRLLVTESVSLDQADQSDLNQPVVEIDTPVTRHSLKSGQKVVWTFEDVPEGWIPYIVLVEGADDRLGPFQVFKQSHDRVVGKGKTEGRGHFTYRAMLRDTRWPRMSVLMSPKVELFQGVDHVIDVAVDLENERFKIIPHEVEIRANQTVFWRFFDLAPEYIPEICFYQRTDRDTEVVDRDVGYFGPFATLSHVADGVLGEGYDGTGDASRFSYFVDVTSVVLKRTHRRLISVNSEDPFVDTVPDAPSPHGEEEYELPES